jgi:hypothetical protein
MKTFIRTLHIARILKILALTIVAVVSLLLVFLVFLPAVVGSKTVQTRIQKSLSSSLKRQVTWSSLVMTWSDGLTLSALKLGDGPAPLLKTDIDQILIVPAIGRGPDGRFGIDCTVRIRNVRAELAPGLEKPPPKPARDPLTLLAESIQRVQGLDFPLPVDVRVSVEAAPLQVVYRVPAPGRQLKLQGFSFRLSVPSLSSKPITAEISGQVLIDDRITGKVAFNAKVSDLVTKEQRIHLASALFAVDMSAPGTNLTFSGGLSQADGFVARWKLDLPELLEVAQPVLPAKVPELEGDVELLLRAKSDSNRDLHVAVTIDGAGLAASGGLLKTGQFGPIDLKLQQQIATDHTRQRVVFSGGTLVVPGLIDAGWRASVDHPTDRERSLEFQCGPVRLDLVRALSLAAPLLPPDSPVRDLAGEMSLRSLTVHLKGPGNKGDLAVAGFGVKLPRVRMALEKGELSAEDISLLLEKVECPLTANLPTRLTAELLWSIKRAAISGTQPLTVQGVRGTVGMTVTDLNLKSSSPRKVTASAVVTQMVDFDRASFGTALIVEKAHEQLRFLARATEHGEIEASFPELTITVDSMQNTQNGKRIGPIPLSASLTAADLRLPAGKGGRLTMERGTAAVSAGDFLQLTTTAALSAQSPQRVTASGNARLDLTHVMPTVAQFLPAGFKADGIVTAVWEMAAPLPDKPLTIEKHPLRSAKAGLSLFDKLELGLKFDTLSATVPSAKGAVTVTGLRTNPDFSFVSTGNGESARLEGGMQFSGLSGLPGAVGKLQNQLGSFVMKGEFSGWKEFRLTEELRIAPLTLSHEAELTVSRIDALLDEKQPFNTATLIKRLDATLFANFDGAFSRELKQLLPGVDVTGNVTGGVRVDLTGGHELALRGSLKTSDFGVQLAGGTKVEGLRSDISIQRAYALAVAAQREGWTPLSTALVRPVPVVTANPGAAEIVGRIHDDLRGDVRGARSFSIRNVTAKVSGVPMVLSALEGDLLFGQEKCGLSFFQADLLGGTLLARGVFDLRSEVPNISAASSFSNLDITYLLPKDAKNRPADQDAEITGEMSLTAPLTPEQRELFEQLRLALNVRKIGANTIERALFSLDPYERNEQVVAQRKMLRLGTLKGLRATAVDGAFSMEGEARIKGVAVDLPKVDRLRISELPLRQELTKNRAGILALRGFLDLVRADTMVVGPKGELSFKRRNYAQ